MKLFHSVKTMNYICSSLIAFLYYMKEAFGHSKIVLLISSRRGHHYTQLPANPQE